MRDYDEKDYESITRLQEQRGCTRDHARKAYKKAVAALADPDHADRATIVMENLNRAVTVSDEVPGEAVEKPAKKQKKAKPAKAAKAEKAVEAKEVVEVANSQHAVPVVEIEEEKHVHTANLFGRKHAVLYISIDRETDNLDRDRFKPPHISETRLDRVKKFAKTNGMPVAVCVQILFNHDIDQGYAVPLDVLKKNAGQLTRGRLAMSLSNESRAAYRDEGWDGCVFEEIVKKDEAAA